MYDNNEWRRTIALLVDEQVRFGVNLLVLPERLAELSRAGMRSYLRYWCEAFRLPSISTERTP